ncbi:MAG TPA: hypothetical protein V6C97_19150 [Oculatellaceae cyanobacterium]
MSNTFRPEAFAAAKNHETKSEFFVPIADRSTILTTSDDRHTTAADFLPKMIIDGAPGSRQPEGEPRVWQPESSAPAHTARPDESRANSPTDKDGTPSEFHLSRTPSGKLAWDGDNHEVQTPHPADWEGMTSKQKDIWNKVFSGEGTGIKHVIMPYLYKNEGGTGWHKGAQDGEWSWVGYVGQETKLPAPKEK